MAQATDDTEDWIYNCIIGTGAFGVVKLWENIRTKEKIAVKTCLIDSAKFTIKQKQRWYREVQFINQFNHPNIVSSRDVPKQMMPSDNGLPVLCMEYCNKGDLRTMLNKAENMCGVNEKEARNIIRDVLSAVEYIHNHKIAHRDLKTDNIVLQQTNDRIVYKLTDLGFAKKLYEKSGSLSIVGTMNYVAPELLSGNTYSLSIDYWSLGVLFYEVVAGTIPFLSTSEMSKKCIDCIGKKEYEHISVQEVNGELVYYENIRDPTQLSDCLKEDLVEWLRVVLQWDPQKRGKPKNSDTLVVFTMMNSILNKKIIHIFIVSHYKFRSYCVDPLITVGNLKLLIQEKESIMQGLQILTDANGKVLNDHETLNGRISWSDIIVAFHDDNLCVVSVPRSTIIEPIQEMVKNIDQKCHSYMLRRYYGSSIFFMNRELKLYESYILALSTKIDLIDSVLKSLDVNIKKLCSDKEFLVDELESVTQLMQSSTIDEYNDYLKLTQKINKFFNSMKKMVVTFHVLLQDSEELKKFSDVIWMGEISDPYDEAVVFTNDWITEKSNKQDKPIEMVKLFLKFLGIREEKLTNPQLTEFCRNIVCIQGRLKQLENVLTSFTELLIFYRQSVKNLHDEIIKAKPITQLDYCGKSSISNTEKIPRWFKSIEEEDDVVINKSIMLSKMLDDLITKIDVSKQKLESLS